MIWHSRLGRADRAEDVETAQLRHLQIDERDVGMERKRGQGVAGVE